MKMWFFTILFALVLGAPITSEAANKYARPKKELSVQTTSNTPQLRSRQGAESDRLNKRRKKKVNKAVSNIEDRITDIADQYRDGSVWKEAANEESFKEGSKWKFLKYPLVAPSYAIRFITWPVALGVDALNKKGVIKKVVNVVSNKDRSFWVYPKFELGFGYGLGAGFGVRHFDLFHRQYEFMASYLIHLNLNQEFTTYLKKDDVFKLFDRPVGFKAITALTHNLDVPYYGVGATTSKKSLSSYKMEAVKTGGWLSYNVIEKVLLQAHLYFEWNDTSPGHGRAPSVNERFALSDITGFGRSIYYLRFGLSLNRSTATPDSEPDTGGVQEAAIYRFQGVNTTEYDYNEFDIGATQYIRAFMPRHVFVIRNQWSFREPFGGRVPLNRYATLDVHSPMRAFNLNRFTDLSSVVLNVEYRYPVWKFLDGQLFIDTGRVFHGPQDFSFKKLSYDGGIGLRLCTSNYFLARIQFGYGAEGGKMLLNTSKEF